MISTTIVWSRSSRSRSSWRLFCLISFIIGVCTYCSLIPSVKCTVTSYKSYPELWRGRRNLSPATGGTGHFDSRMRQTQSAFDTSPYYYYFNKRMGEEQMGNASVSDIVLKNTYSNGHGPSYTTINRTSDNDKVLDINSSDAGIRNGNVPLRGKFRRRRVKKRRNGTIIPVEDKFFPQLNDSESVSESVGLDSTTSSEISTIISTTTEDSVADTTELTTTENYPISTENVIFDENENDVTETTTERSTKENDISVKSSSSGETYEIIPMFMRPGIWNDKGNSLEIIASTTPAGTKRRRKMRMQRRRKRPNAMNNLNNHRMFEHSGNNLLTNSAVSDLYSSESANPYVHNGSTPISSDLRNTLLFDHLNYFHPLLTADSIVSSKEKRPEDKNVAIEHSLSEHVGNIPVAHDLIYTKPHPLFNLDSVISSKEEILKSHDGPNYFYPSSSFYDSENSAREIITESTTSRGDPMETYQFDQFNIHEHEPTTYKPHVSISPTVSSKKPPTLLLPKKTSITTTTTTTSKATSKPTVITTTRTTTTTTTPPTTTRKTTTKSTSTTPQRTRGTTIIPITAKPTPKPFTQSPQQQKATTNPDTLITLTSSFKSNPQKEAENIRQSIILAQQNKIKEEKAVVKTTTKLTTPKPILTTQAIVPTTTATTTTNILQQLFNGLGSQSQTTKLPGTDIFSNLFTTPSTTTRIHSQINNNAGLNNLFGLNQNPSLTNNQQQQNGGLNDIFNLLNIFQPQATTVAPLVVSPSLSSQDTSSASATETKGGSGSSLEELTAQLELLEGLVKGLSIHSADQNQQSATNGIQQSTNTNGAPSSSSGGLSEADLKSIFSLIDTNQKISPIMTTSKPTTTTTTTTPKPTTTTAKPAQFTIPTTTLHPVLKNMLDIFTGGISPQNQQNQNPQIDFSNLFGQTTPRPQILATTTLKPFLDSVLNAIQQQQPNESQNQQQNVKVPPPSTTATSSNDLFAQLLNLGLAADNLQQQSNSVRSPTQQQQQPATVLGPQPIPSFDLASLFGLNNFATQFTTTTQAPRIQQQQNPLDLSQLLSLFGGNNNGGNNNFLQPQPQKRQSPSGLYYWLDLNTFFGGDPSAEPFSGFRPKLGARDHFIRVQRNTVADKRDGGYFG